MAAEILTPAAVNDAVSVAFPGSRARCVELGERHAIATVTTGEQDIRPGGFIAGPTQFALADAAMGMAYYSTLEPGESFATLELKINFLRPFWTGTLLARGSVVHRGRTVGMTECDVVDERDRLIAKATGTCMTLRGEAAEGR